MELSPFGQHGDVIITPDWRNIYNPKTDTFRMIVIPRCAVNWAETAYKFAKQPGMKYDREREPYGIDGQPRVSSSGGLWVRYIGNFEDGSRVTFHIWSRQPSHGEAEEQLSRLYAFFKERDGLEPMHVFKAYF
jgi:hypothetical protein